MEIGRVISDKANFKWKTVWKEKRQAIMYLYKYQDNNSYEKNKHIYYLIYMFIYT